MSMERMRAGYQGKPDAMRERADKLMNKTGMERDGSVPQPVINSSGAMEKTPLRTYREGGPVLSKFENKEGKSHRLSEDMLIAKKDGGHIKNVLKPKTSGKSHMESEKGLYGPGKDRTDKKESFEINHHPQKKNIGEGKNADTNYEKIMGTLKKFAMGGVAKMRHDEADKKGQPIKTKKIPYERTM